MADFAIFQDQEPAILGVVVDIKQREAHGSTSVVSKRSIEDGSLSSDHIVEQPDTVEVTGLISNIDEPGTPAQGRRAATSFNFLRLLKSTRAVFDVLTVHAFYDNMALTSLAAVNVAPFSGEITIVAGFERLDTVRTVIAEVPASQLQSTGANPVDKQASSEVDAGRVDPTQPEENRSLAAQILDSLGSE